MGNSRTFVIIGGGLAGAKAVEALREKDFDGRIIVCAEEDRLPYERPPLSKEFLAGNKLLLATGSRSRRPNIPGADAAGVHYLRTFDDALALDSVLVEGSSLAVVGAGWIGLEVAASA